MSKVKVADICPSCYYNLLYDSSIKTYECYFCGDKFIMCADELISFEEYDDNRTNKEFDVVSTMNRNYGKRLAEGFSILNDEDI